MNLNNLTGLLQLQCGNNDTLSSLYIHNGSKEDWGIDFTNTPNLTFICADAFQVDELRALANANATVSSDCLLVTNEVEPKMSVAVFPNPGLDVLNISSSSLIHSIELFDLHGRKLRKLDVHGKDLTFDITQLISGIYFLKLISNQGSVFRKNHQEIIFPERLKTGIYTNCRFFYANSNSNPSNSHWQTTAVLKELYLKRKDQSNEKTITFPTVVLCICKRTAYCEHSGCEF